MVLNEEIVKMLESLSSFYFIIFYPSKWLMP